MDLGCLLRLSVDSRGLVAGLFSSGAVQDVGLVESSIGLRETQSGSGDVITAAKRVPASIAP